MKRLAVFLLLLCPVAASGQVYRIYNSGKASAEKPWVLSGVDSSPNYARYHNSAGWTYYLQISDTSFVMKLKGRETFYLGRAKSSTANGMLRQGFGVTKELTDSTGVYLIGWWKRDFLSGPGYRVAEDGSVMFAEWKNGKPMKGTERPATESEAGFVRTRMKKIDSAIRVFRGRLTR